MSKEIPYKIYLSENELQRNAEREKFFLLHRPKRKRLKQSKKDMNTILATPFISVQTSMKFYPLMMSV